MDFRESDRAREYRERLEAFMDECVYPAEATIAEQVRASGDPHHHPAAMEELKAELEGNGVLRSIKDDGEADVALWNKEIAKYFLGMRNC